MIVFTVTNTESGRVFVASSRNAPEDRWEQLITQANEGSEGEIFDEIRDHNPAVFNVEEWGFGEDPKEIRQLMREAQQDLGAIVVNTGKMDALPPAKRKKLSDREAAKLLEEIEKSLAGGDSDDDAIPTPSKSLDDIAPDETSEAVAETQNSAAESASSSPQEAEVATPAPKVRTESLIEQMARKVEREKIAANAQKLTQKKSLTLSKSKTVDKNVKAKAPTKETLPTGRASSKAKEQKIREGIEKERENRAMARQAAERREAVEMRKIIASIELRRKTQRPVKAKAKPKTAAEKQSTTTPSTAKESTPALDQLTVAQVAQAFREEAPAPAPEKQGVQLLDRAMAIKTAKALNEIIRAKRAQQYAPKAPVVAKSKTPELTVQDKRLQRMIEKEKAMLEAKKAAMTSASAEEMSAVMARIDSRSEESSRTLRRR